MTSEGGKPIIRKIKRVFPQEEPPTIKNRTWKRAEVPVTQRHYNLRSNKGTNCKSLVADVLLTQQIFSVQHIFNGAGDKLSLDKILGVEHGGARWKPALSNKWGRLAQCNDAGVSATDTIHLVHYQNVPKENKFTYASFV